MTEMHAGRVENILSPQLLFGERGGGGDTKGFERILVRDRRKDRQTRVQHKGKGRHTHTHTHRNRQTVRAAETDL